MWLRFDIIHQNVTVTVDWGLSNFILFFGMSEINVLRPKWCIVVWMIANTGGVLRSRPAAITTSRLDRSKRQLIGRFRQRAPAWFSCAQRQLVLSKGRRRESAAVVVIEHVLTTQFSVYVAGLSCGKQRTQRERGRKVSGFWSFPVGFGFEWQHPRTSCRAPGDQVQAGCDAAVSCFRVNHATRLVQWRRWSRQHRWG